MAILLHVPLHRAILLQVTLHQVILLQAILLLPMDIRLWEVEVEEAVEVEVEYLMRIIYTYIIFPLIRTMVICTSYLVLMGPL